MKTKNLITAAVCAATVLAFVDSQADEGDDQIVASFDRELNHEPGPAAEATGEAIDNDELYRAVNLPLQSNDGTEEPEPILLAEKGDD